MARLLIISATSDSNLKLAEELQAVAEELGATSELVVLEALKLPLFDSSEEEIQVPEVAKDLVKQLQDSQGMILIAPEYNGGMPPVVSNALTWMSVADADFRTAFNGRFAALGTHSGGGGHRVLDAMRQQLIYLGMVVLPRTFLNNSQKTQSPDSARAILTQLVHLLQDTNPS